MKFATIVAACGIALLVSLSPVFAGSEGFTLPINPNDPCDGGATPCRYVFTAKSGSNKQITMARKNADDADYFWIYYDMPIFTKSQVQAGYYWDNTDNVVLMVVYSADQEGKGGA